MKININDCVVFKVTDAGEEVIRRYVLAGNAHPVWNDPISSPLRHPGEYKMQMWEFMKAFGPNMALGAQQLIRNNELFFIKSSEET